MLFNDLNDSLLSAENVEACQSFLTVAISRLCRVDTE